MENSNALSDPVFQLGTQQFSPAALLILCCGVILILIFALIYMVASRSRSKLIEDSFAEDRARDTELLMAEILKSQSEMQGRMQTMAELFGSRQAELNQSIRERLDGMTSRIGQSMTEQARSTHENLAKLQERLAVIDTAQNNIQSLAGQVVQLQAILANKQTRGAFGQSRMEAIIADALPPNAYEFQATLSNGTRPDCLIRMPNNSPDLVIDAKFPLEAWNNMRSHTSPEARKNAAMQFRRDMETHLKDISEKYLLNGETQDTAFMFVPSESIFADIHEHFEVLIQRAHRLRVIIVSPSLLMLSIQVIQSVLKDARMREQAHLIQDEVVRLMEDVSRLDDRVRKLQTHFSQASRDVEDILISTSKVIKRSAKIEALEFAENTASENNAVEKTAKQSPSASGSIQMHLHHYDK